MNKQATHNTSRQETPATLASHQFTSVNPQTATETIYKVAEVARTLKLATHVMEKVVHIASGTNEHLTLLHWLVLVRLTSTPTCKQMELKSDTKIAAAYLTRLLDDLTREGLVRRHRSSSDRRQILLALTEHGRSSALELLAALNNVTQPSQLNAIEHLRASLEQFVSLSAGEEWFGLGRSP
jgi:DNA-binding MarR family transcriptional regulator